MTHAERYSTSEPSACPPARKKTRTRVVSILALATGLGLASVVITSARPAAADQIAVALGDKISAVVDQLGIDAEGATQRALYLFRPVVRCTQFARGACNQQLQRVAIGVGCGAQRVRHGASNYSEYFQQRPKCNGALP